MRGTTAGLAVGLAVAVLLGGLTDRLVLLLATLLVQGLLAAVWLSALGVPGAGIGRGVVAAAAVAADLAVLATDDTGPMAHVPPVLALALVAALAHQLARRDGRPRLAASLTGVVTGSVVVALGSAWLAVDVSQDGTSLLVVGTVAATAVSLAGHARPGALPRAATAGLVALTALATAALAAATSDTGLGAALAVAVGATVGAALGALTAARVAVPHPVLPAVLPLLLAAPVVYLLARLLVG